MFVGAYNHQSNKNKRNVFKIFIIDFYNFLEINITLTFQRLQGTASVSRDLLTSTRYKIDKEHSLVHSETRTYYEILVSFTCTGLNNDCYLKSPNISTTLQTPSGLMTVTVNNKNVLISNNPIFKILFV